MNSQLNVNSENKLCTYQYKLGCGEVDVQHFDLFAIM